MPPTDTGTTIHTVAPLETPLEPDLPIIDPHHHLWGISGAILAGVTEETARSGFERVSLRVPRYLFDEIHADVTRGHNVIATVFVQCHAMYRADGPAWLTPVGETEFANGIAAMSASGVYGESRICAGIVGSADLRLGDRSEEVLLAHMKAGGERFKGIRQSAAWDADPAILGGIARTGPGLLLDNAFREGFARLGALGLSFDAWLLEPQLPDLIDLARALPDVSIILNHVGAPLGVGPYAGRREEFFPRWRQSMSDLASLPNVTVKLGGLGIECAGFPSFLSERRRTSAELADEWRPYVETSIELFGPRRCMFETNYPTESGTADYVTIWNAFKRLARSASPDEKRDLFCDTARRAYRLNLPD
ncbi:amidohydrolase family protein [Phenylobacterium sp.]|uniref:amidohydrolase family protein n=1 Tax=Phenylobacterium sp. TaxID=1871053 RepID=UPI002E2EBBD6|nr:amidohydrolase family protein [Phenylobacterium sp.]HEX3364634.1 amidohydrolase family protein [Phenylobacterium sp.]